MVSRLEDVKIRPRRKIFGECINDAGYPVRYTLDGVNYRCPFYMRWYGIITRCYSKPFLVKNPAYKGCSVCEEWKIFSNFKAWMEKQDWVGKQIDKDLLVEGNKVYSPETCIFISETLNKTLVTRKLHRSLLGLGVIKDKNCYAAQCQGKRLGSYRTTLLAHKAWQKCKISSLEKLIELESDIRVIKGINRIINKIKDDLSNDRFTDSL